MAVNDQQSREDPRTVRLVAVLLDVDVTCQDYVAGCGGVQHGGMLDLPGVYNEDHLRFRTTSEHEPSFFSLSIQLIIFVHHAQQDRIESHRRRLVGLDHFRRSHSAPEAGRVRRQRVCQPESGRPHLGW